MKNRQAIVIGIAALILLAWRTDDNAQSQSIGSVMAVERQADVTHPDRLEVAMVKLGEPVLFKDLYETKAQSRLKLLFEDDSILSLAENTKLKITENIYDPAKSQRSTVIDLVNGSVRALVGKFFGGAGSKFEIHTPTAAAAARGTYFIVWTSKEGGQDPTGVVNIGESGKVVVSNINPAVKGSVELKQNQYTLIDEGKPPIPAALISPSLLKSLVTSTEVKNQVKQEVPKGMEAPGSDVSAEVVTPVTGTPGTKGGGTPTGGETTTPSLPSVPPIVQQPPTNKTPVNVNVNFP
jgi:hypothetical protein